LEEFIRAAKRVAKVNKSLRSFEAGFISDEGIKDREWYRHLGVAPGKWLGRGSFLLVETIKTKDTYQDMGPPLFLAWTRL